MASKSYNGWKNYVTWNVALWIRNDAGFYHLALESETYGDFVTVMRELGSTETPYEVAWNDSGIDTESLYEHFEEWREVTE